jgi:cystathionine beta-synthase
MKKYDIENIPVLNGENPVGSISESGLFFKLIQQPDIRNHTIAAVMEPPYPVVAFDTPVERLSTLISKDNGAVLSKDDSGAYHIVTKYDVIQSLSK